MDEKPIRKKKNQDIEYIRKKVLYKHVRKKDSQDYRSILVLIRKETHEALKKKKINISGTIRALLESLVE